MGSELIGPTFFSVPGVIVYFLANGPLIPSPLSGGDAEQQGTAVLKQKDIRVTVDLGIGTGQATVYTSDLSHDYVSINADYRT